MKKFKKTEERFVDWAIAGILGVVAAVLYFASQADYAFPGISAHLQALWRGLDASSAVEFPLMAPFAKALGGGNLIAPVSGVVAVMALYMLVKFFVYERIRGEDTQALARSVSRLAGAAAAVVFMLTPAVRAAATHLEPKMFDAAWALLSLALLIPYARAPKALAWLFPILVGVMFALGFCDSALFLALAPVALGGLVVVSLKRGGKPYLPAFLFLASAFFAFLVAVSVFEVEAGEILKNAARELGFYHRATGWLFIAAFAALPCAAVLFSSHNAYNEKPGLVQWFYHVALTFVTILACTPSLSPSVLMEAYGYLPVATSAFAAIVAGHLVSYWWIHRRTVVGLVSGGALGLVLLAMIVWNLFTFDGRSGAFADRVAEKVLEDLGSRTWIVSDGSLDDHLLLLAAQKGKTANIVSMNRDLDDDYLARLSDRVRAARLGGEKCAELALSAKLGVLPFVQDWFSADASVKTNVVVFSVPDLWLGAGITPVPEFLFFGGDETREPDTAAWKEFDALLSVPKGWGSYSHRYTDNPVEAMRYGLRRHIGFVANDRGVYLEDKGRKDEAYETYERVLREIDGDNICALFNELEMANAKYPKALARKRELGNEVDKIVKDKQRRYQLWWLGRYYGYIRNPDIYVRLGYTWARSGRPGDALAHIRRAIDFVGDERRLPLLNMMAALYAGDADRGKSRKIYEGILAKDAKNHDALVGLMRLELMDGNEKAALAYLERATSAAPENTRTAQIERAMAAMMRGDLASAAKILRKLTDANAKDLQAWSLLATAIMQLSDAEKDAKRRAAFDRELSESILPTMENLSNGPFDYYVRMTKAFLLLRQGGEKRREARDAFVSAAKARPDVAIAQDLALGLDISLNDPENAETHAREVLRRNRKAPLANYVMGSLAMGRGDNVAAETYLLRAVDTPKPTPLALNDLAELYRRTKRPDLAERAARRAIKVAPKLYVCWETLASALLDRGVNLDEAEAAAKKACELSRDEKGRERDVRMLVTLARVQVKKGDLAHARGSIRKVRARIAELNEFEKREFEEFAKGVR